MGDAPDPYGAAERDGEHLAADYQDEAGNAEHGSANPSSDSHTTEDEKMETQEHTDGERADPDDVDWEAMAEGYQERYDSDDDGDDPFAEMSTIPATERDTLRMEVAVDVSDMDDRDREAINKLSRLYEEAFQEVVNKNRDYSFSFLRTGQKLAETPATPFDDPARAQAFGLLTRQGDKRERLIENVYGNGDASVSDSPDVTAVENANYYFFLALVLRHPDLCTEL